MGRVMLSSSGGIKGILMSQIYNQVEAEDDLDSRMSGLFLSPKLYFSANIIQKIL
jgi:hypothetical protein